MSTRSPRWDIVGPFFLVALIWGSTWLVIKDQISAVPPSWTVTWRFALAALGMMTLALVRRDPLRLPPGGQRLALIVGVLQFFGNFQLVYRSELYLTSGIVAVFYALLLVPNALLSRIFLGARVGAGFLAGSAVAIAGIALLMLHEYRLAPPSASVPLGILFAGGGLLCASCANVLLASKAAASVRIVPLLGWAMIWGAATDAVFAFAISGSPVFDPRPVYWGGVAYLALVGSVLTFPLYFGLIRTIGAGRAAYNGVLVPVVAMLLSTLFEGYRWSLLAAAGSVLALAGLVIALAARRPDRREPAPIVAE